MLWLCLTGVPLQIKTSISVENRVQDEIDKMNSNLSLMKHLQQQVNGSDAFP